MKLVTFKRPERQQHYWHIKAFALSGRMPLNDRPQGVALG